MSLKGVWCQIVKSCELQLVSNVLFQVQPVRLYIAVTKHWVDRQAEWCHGSYAHQRRAGKAAAADQSLRPPSEMEWVNRLSRTNNNQARTRAAARALSQLDTDVVNQQLIVDLVQWFVNTAGGDVDNALASLPGARADNWDRGMAEKESREKDEEDGGGGGGGGGGTAILVFLPGTKEIDNVRELLVAAAGRSKMDGKLVLDPDWVLPLHGALPPDDQRKVFQRPPPGRVKVRRVQAS